MAELVEGPIQLPESLVEALVEALVEDKEDEEVDGVVALDDAAVLEPLSDEPPVEAEGLDTPGALLDGVALFAGELEAAPKLTAVPGLAGVVAVEALDDVAAGLAPVAEAVEPEALNALGPLTEEAEDADFVVLGPPEPAGGLEDAGCEVLEGVDDAEPAPELASVAPSS